jgi:hypothetical protein
VYRTTSDDLCGNLFQVIDAAANSGYQAGNDYVIEIVIPVTTVVKRKVNIDA